MKGLIKTELEQFHMEMAEIAEKEERELKEHMEEHLEEMFKWYVKNNPEEFPKIGKIDVERETNIEEERTKEVI